MHPAKRGAIPASTPPLFGRLGMDADAFIASAHHFFKDFASAVGTPAKLIKLAANRQPPTANRQPPTANRQRQQRYLRGLAAVRRVFEAKAA